MSSISLFLARNSQKIALSAAGITLTSSYLLQPYYEVFIRWNLIARKGSEEKKPSDRIKRLADEVSRCFVLDRRCQASLDIFLTELDQSVTLGSLRKPGYAFIGIPEFAAYSDASEISVESAKFYTPEFPHGPYSPIGKQRIDLMLIPDGALRFLIAREFVRLGAKSLDGLQAAVSGRRRAMLTVWGIVGGLYGVYQACYLLNRAYRLPSRVIAPVRFLIYTTLTTLGLFTQWQVALAWRRHTSLTVDRITAQLPLTSGHSSMRLNGIAYYDWRLRWNQFWFERAVERDERAQKHRERIQQTAAAKREQGDDTQIKAPQVEQNQQLKQSGMEVAEGAADGKVSVDEGYHLPHTAFQPDESTTVEYGLAVHSKDASQPLTGFQYHIHPRVARSGLELWAADGDAVGIGFTELLQTGVIPSPLARLFSWFSQPATSLMRRSHLAELKPVLSGVS